MKLYLLFILFFISISSLRATNYYVNDNSLTGDIYCSAIGNDANNGTDPSTPKATIEAIFTTYGINSGDIIYVDAGTYTEVDVLPYSADDDGFSIQGASSTLTIFDGTNSGDRFMNLQNSHGNVAIDDVKFYRYTISGSGAVFSIGDGDCNLTLTDCIVDDCDVTGVCSAGGLAYMYKTNTLTITNCTITNCDTDNNSCDYGGVLYMANGNGTLNITGSTFSNNSAGSGGVIHTSSNGTGVITITSSTFNGNSNKYPTYADGGVFSCSGTHTGDITFDKCTFYDNTSIDHGSAIYIDTDGTTYIKNCLFYENTASDDAALYYYCAGTQYVTNCTFADNTASGPGGLFAYSLGALTVEVKNTVFYNNIGSGTTVDDCDAGSESINFTNCSYTSAADIDLNGGSNTSPQVGDPSFTNAAGDDYSISSSSHCVDAGTSTGAPADDIVGTSRGGSPDIGAYEASSNEWTGATNTSWLIGGNWSLGSAPGVGESPTIPNVANQPEITSAVTIAGLTVETGADITVTSNSLTITGSMDLDGTLYIDNAAVSVDGAFDATGGTIDMTNSNASLTLSSTVTSLGTLDAEMGTVQYDGGTQTVLSDSYYNLTISTAGTKTAAGNIDVDGDFITAATATCALDLTTYDLNVAGDLTVGATDGLDASDASCLVTIDGSSDQTVTHAGSTGGTSTVELVNEDFSSFSTGTLTEVVSTTSTYQIVGNCTTDAGKWKVSSSAGSYKGTCGACSGNRATIEYVGSSCTQDNTIKTKQFSPTTTSLDISFDWSNDHYGGQYFEVYLYNETDGAQVGADLVYSTADANNQAYSGTVTLSGSNSVSDSYTLNFHHYNNNDWGSQFDNILITEEVAQSGAEFNELTINKASGNLLLSSEINVDGTLTFTSGDIDATSNNLVLTENGSFSGADDDSHVIGTIVRTLASTSEADFPLGDGTELRQVNVTPPDGTSRDWTVSYTSSAYGDLTLTGSLTNVSSAYYWDITPSSAANSSVIDLNWTSNPGIQDADLTNIKLAHFTGTDWEEITTTTAGTTTAGSVSGTVSSFSPFTIGTVGANPLPIKLVTFYGEKGKQNNILKWTTASEKNNDYFTIEKTTDGKEFYEVGRIEGAGNSIYHNSYSLTDANVDEVLNYYRLVQTDFDGDKEYSNLITIDNRGSQETERTLIQITNTWGQEINEDYIGVAIYIYSDGSIERVFKN